MNFPQIVQRERELTLRIFYLIFFYNILDYNFFVTLNATLQIKELFELCLKFIQ